MNLKKITLVVTIVIALLITIKLVFNFEFSPLKFLKSKISWETKVMIAKKILPYKYINLLEKDIQEKNKIIDKKNKIIGELSNNEIFTYYKKKSFEKDLINIKYFKNPNFINYGPRSYFAKDNNNLYLISGTTNTYFTAIKNFDY